MTHSRKHPFKHIWSAHCSRFSSTAVAYPSADVEKILTQTIRSSDHHYFIVDFAQPNELYKVSPKTSSFLNHHLKKPKVVDLLKQVHPDDIDYMKACEDHIFQFLTVETKGQDMREHLFSYQYRFRMERAYRLLLHQSAVLSVDGFGRISKMLFVHTLINHIATTNSRKLSIKGLNGNAIHQIRNIWGSSQNNELLRLLSEREIQVIRCFSEGNTAQRTAELLHISEHTVRTHRKNILKKTNCNNMTALVKLCTQEGLI